jgi:hypothetical protein
MVREDLPILGLEEYPYQLLVVEEANLVGDLEHQGLEEVVVLLK